MENILETCDEASLEEIIQKAKDFALINGGGMRVKTTDIPVNRDSLQFVPFTLLPSPVSREGFDKAVTTQALYNTLIHKAAHSHKFLSSALKNAIKVDEFTRNLYNVYDKVREEGFKQGLSLGLLRSDYLADWDGSYRQVEINTISVSLGGLSQVISDTHRYVLEELGHRDKCVNLPKNRALQGMASGLIRAWENFDKPESVVLFVVEEDTVNICDQRLIEYEVRRQSPATGVLRRKFSQLAKNVSLTEEGHLILSTGEIVAVAYYRAGYDPEHYRCQEDWDTRITVERSTAIKCPSIQYHLAGTKKVQQVLCKKGVLEELLDCEEEAKIARSMFAAIHSLDFDADGDEGLRLAMNNPGAWVLKPQREGGGNNVYGEEVAAGAAALGEARPGWVLMERIRPRAAPGLVLRPGRTTRKPVPVVSELGVFGVILGSADEILINSQIGHTLRTKLSSSDEGGVSAGSGALDSPYLV